MVAVVRADGGAGSQYVSTLHTAPRTHAVNNAPLLAYTHQAG